MSDQLWKSRSFAAMTGTFVSRRSFVKLAAVGVAGTSLVSLLSACADDDDVDIIDDESDDSVAVETEDDADDEDSIDDDTEEIDDDPEELDDDPDDAEPDAVGEGGDVSVLWRAPVTLNPLHSSSGNEQQVQRLLFGSLIKMNDVLEPTPDLSETIDVSDDATSFTFTLHEGIRFNDGEPLTSEDVVFTLTRAVDQTSGSRWRGRLLVIDGVEAFDEGDADEVSGIVAHDDRTVEVILSEPSAGFLVDLCNFSGLGILPEHVLGDVPPEQLEENEFSLNPTVSAGAYEFVRYETDQFLELARNDDYFAGPPALDRIFLRILTIDVGQAQLETGEIHVMAVPVSEMERVEQIQDVEVLSVPSPSMDFFAINLNREHLQDQRLRAAMMHAIDRQAIVDQVFEGEAQLVNSSIFGPEWMGTPEGLNEYPYDIERAQELLEESDWDGTVIEITHLTGRSTEMDDVVTIVQQQWTEIGLDVEISQVDSAELNRRYIADNDYDVFYNAGGVFRADPNVSATYFLTENFTPDGGNGSHYSNPEVDELFAEARATSDEDERRELYNEIAQILNEELPWIYLWSPNSLYGVSNRLQGFEPPSYVDNKLWNAEDWSLTD